MGFLWETEQAILRSAMASIHTCQPVMMMFIGGKEINTKTWVNA